MPKKAKKRLPPLPKKFIVKVQLPVAGDMAGQCLIYNESRSIENILPAPKGLSKLLVMGVKGYFWAHMRGTLVVLDKPAPWQNW